MKAKQELPLQIKSKLKQETLVSSIKPKASEYAGAITM